MAKNPTSSTHVPGNYSEIDLNVELGLFPVMVPSLFLPNPHERPQNETGKPGQCSGADSEERVYRILENYDRDKYMVVFHGTKINKTKITEISTWFDFHMNIDKDLVKYHPRISLEDVFLLDVRLRIEPIEMTTERKGFDFNVYTHEKIVVVILEVKDWNDIEEGHSFAYLQESAALVESVKPMDSATEHYVIAKILCCPMLKLKSISPEAEKMMNYENIFIVCDDNSGFDQNLRNRLDWLQKNDDLVLRKIKLSIIHIGDVYFKHSEQGRVIGVLFNHYPSQNKCVPVTEENKRSWTEKICPFDIHLKLDKELVKKQYLDDVTSYDVQLRSSPEKTEPGSKEFDFIVIHEKFVAVLEVKSFTNFAHGCKQLQQSAALVESVMKVMKDDPNAQSTNTCVINKILCCPKLRKKMISLDAKDKMTSENMFIVCDDGLGFEKNLNKLLNSLSENKASWSLDLKKLTRPLADIYYGDGESKTWKSSGDIVYKELEKYSHHQEKYMVIFRGIEITKEHSQNIWKGNPCYCPFDFKAENETSSLVVRIKDPPSSETTGKTEFNIIVIHEKYVAVLEVKDLIEKSDVNVIKHGYKQLQESATLLESVMDGDTRLVINKILCCPKVKQIKIECTDKMFNEKLFIVCDDGKGFEENLTDLLENRLHKNEESKRPCFLRKLTGEIEYLYYTSLIMNKSFGKKQTWSSGKLFRAMDFFIRTQNVRYTKKIPLEDKFKLTENIGFNKYRARHLIYLTTQQEEAFNRKKMIMIGAAGTGKTALIIAKVIELVKPGICDWKELIDERETGLVKSKPGEKIVIVPSADCNRANFENHSDDVEIWTPQYLEDTLKLGDIVKDLHEIYEWKQSSEEYNKEKNDVIDKWEQSRRVFKDESGVEAILDTWELLVKKYEERSSLASAEKDFIDKWEQLIKDYEVRSDARDIIDIWGQLVKAYKEQSDENDIKKKWVQLIEMYEVRHGVRDVIDIGEQLARNECWQEMLARNEEWSHVSLYQLDQWMKECKASCGIAEIWKQLMKECTKWTGLKDSIDKWELLIRNYHVRSDLKYITDILEKFIKVYSEGNHVKDIIDEWKKLIKKYEVRNNERNIIDEGEQLIKKYKDRSGVRHSLNEFEQLTKEYEEKTGDERQIIDKWKHLMNEYTETEVKDVKNILQKGKQIANRYREESGKRCVNDESKLDAAKKRFKDDQLHANWNVMNHLSKIVGLYVGRLVTDHIGDESNENHLLNDANWRKNEMKRIQGNVLPAIKDPYMASVMERLGKNWENVRHSLGIVFDKSHFFIDDAFSGNTDCHDIFSYFALEWLNKKTENEHKEDQTKCFWMAGDLSQLMHNERKYSYEKLFVSYKDEIPGIHDAVVWLDAVMRCGQSVFEAWEQDRETILSLLGQDMFLDDNVTTGTASRGKNRMLRAGFGFHHPGSATVFKPEDFKQVVDLVENITNRIKSLTRDKFLTQSDFAVLCCDVSGHEMVLSAVQKQFQHDDCLTQSIAEFHRDGKQEDKRDEILNKIVLDSAGNSVGLEWPVVFVICSDLHAKSDHKFAIQKYLACSRCRVRLFVYPELPSKIFKHGNGASCSVCRQVRREKMLEGIRRLDGTSSEASGVLATSLDETFIVDQFESLYDRNEELEARVRNLEQERMEISQRLQIIENVLSLHAQKEDFEARGQDLE